MTKISLWIDEAVNGYIVTYKGKLEITETYLDALEVSRRIIDEAILAEQEELYGKNPKVAGFSN